MGDFNSDGKTDLVTNNGNVLLGKGDGTFQLPVTYSTGSNPLSVAVGDINGDGVTDLVFSDGVVSVLIGTGTGTFQAPSIYSLANAASSVLVSEFSTDGKTDLALASGNTVSLPDGNHRVGYGDLGYSAIDCYPHTVRGATAGHREGWRDPGERRRSDVHGSFGRGHRYVPPGHPHRQFVEQRTAITDGNGVASVSATANAISGSYFVTATALGVSTSFSLTNLSGSNLTLTPSPTTPQSTLRNTAFAEAAASHLEGCLRLAGERRDGYLYRAREWRFGSPLGGYGDYQRFGRGECDGHG